MAFVLTSSSSMLAEAIHSLADSGNQALLLIGGKRARKGATAAHPFGYGRERYIYAFVVSIVLFSVGGLFALYEAYHKWLEPHGITQWRWVPVAVLLGAVVMEGFSFRTAIKEARPQRGGKTWVQFIRTAKAPELPVVLLEDFAALIGLVFALFGVILTLITGSGLWDAAGTALIGILLVAVAVVLAVETKSLLLGESASAEMVRAIENAITGESKTRIIHIKTLHLGPEELLVTAKIAIGRADTGAEVARSIGAAEQRIRRAVPMACVIYLEPDIYASPTTPDADAG